MIGTASNSTHRRGVTLVELLVTITILAILGSAVLFASFSATQAARAAATRAKVASLHSLVTEKYDEFQTRRIDVESRQPDWRLRSANRLKALRIVMRMEMPDRWSDITFSEIASDPANTTVKTPPIGRTALSQAYFRRFQQVAAATNKLTKQPNTRDEVLANQGAECLYMIVTLATADGEALGMFRQSDIGDVDGDGAPEFLDGWGRPIQFLHAAPGFTPYSDLQTGDPVADHDPFDHYRVDELAYRLVPLIYSAGPDGSYDLETRPQWLAIGQNLFDPRIEIFDPTIGGADLGRPRADDSDGENWHDNIHNHDQSVRQ